MKLISLVAALFVSSLLMAQKTINDPNAEVRQVSTFKGIKVSSAFDVYITQGNEDAVAVSAATKEYRDKIETKVENGVLTIRFDFNNRFFKGFTNDKVRLKAYISVKELEKLYVSGACNVYMEEGIKGKDLVIHVSGASDVKAKLDVEKLDANVSGASDLNVKGKAGRVDVDATGASEFQSFDLVTDYCDAHASGASSISITVNKELSAKASGASDVRFKGEGLMRDVKTSGASSISRRG